MHMKSMLEKLTELRGFVDALIRQEKQRSEPGLFHQTFEANNSGGKPIYAQRQNIFTANYPVSPEVEQDECANSNHSERYLKLQRAVEEADRINEEYFKPLKEAFESGNMSETQRLYNRIADEKPSCYLVTVIEPAKQEVVEFGKFDL